MKNKERQSKMKKRDLIMNVGEYPEDSDCIDYRAYYKEVLPSAAYCGCKKTNNCRSLRCKLIRMFGLGRRV